MKISNENFQIQGITTVRSIHSDIEYYVLYNDLIDCNSDYECEQKVDIFLNNFCASATPTTHTLTVTSVATTTDISIKTITKQFTITDVRSTTIFSTIATTKTKTVIITPIIQSCSPQVTNKGLDTTITTIVCPSYIQYDPE